MRFKSKPDVWRKVPPAIWSQCGQIDKSIKFTEEKINVIKNKIEPYLKEFDGKNISLVLAGSTGRKEAHATSDVDAYFCFEDNIQKKECELIGDILLQRLKSIVESQEVGLRIASLGAFSNICSVNDIISNIGGRNDTNDTLTRRILLLTEGYGIPEDSLFKQIREQILNKYLSDLQSSHDKRPVFLINDVIRYYRTICVDYEYKKNEKGKPWAVRLTKLRHSRKLLYFSALLPLLESIRKPKERLSWLTEQFIMYTPLERIVLLLEQYGKTDHWKLLPLYNNFLDFIAAQDRRDSLDGVDFDNREKSELYVYMRNNARAFRDVFHDFIFSVSHWQEPVKKYVLS